MSTPSRWRRILYSLRLDAPADHDDFSLGSRCECWACERRKR